MAAVPAAFARNSAALPAWHAFLRANFSPGQPATTFEEIQTKPNLVDVSTDKGKNENANQKNDDGRPLSFGCSTSNSQR